MIVRFIDFLRARLGLVIRLCFALLGLLVLFDVLFVNKEEVESWFEELPGFWAAFGFVACIVMIRFSKWFGHQGIMTREDYYDR